MTADKLTDILKGAESDFRDRWENYRDEFHQGEPHDVIHEIADSSIPVYTGDLLELANENNSLATDKPELGPAFGGEPTPTNIIAANVFEAIEQHLWDVWREIEDEDEES
jgi:hypothetical protein